jgi:hypothetical protein
VSGAALRPIVLGSIVLAVSAPAFAQLKPETPTGSHIPVKPKAVDRERTGYIIKGFGRCIFGRNKAMAQRFLKFSDPVAIDYAKVGTTELKLAKDLGMEECLGKQVGFDQNALGLRMTLPALRARLLEEDYLTHYRTPPSNLPEVSTVRTYVAQEADLPKAKAVGEFSDCVVKEDFRGSDALVRTMPGGDEERAVARALAPALGKCLNVGQQLELTPSSVRTYVVDGLWMRYVGAQLPSFGLKAQ